MEDEDDFDIAFEKFQYIPEFSGEHNVTEEFKRFSNSIEQITKTLNHEQETILISLIIFKLKGEANSFLVAQGNDYKSFNNLLNDLERHFLAHSSFCPKCNSYGHSVFQCQNNFCPNCNDYGHSHFVCQKNYCPNCNNYGHAEFHCQNFTNNNEHLRQFWQQEPRQEPPANYRNNNRFNNYSRGQSEQYKVQPDFNRHFEKDISFKRDIRPRSHEQNQFLEEHEPTHKAHEISSKELNIRNSSTNHKHIVNKNHNHEIERNNYHKDEQIIRNTANAKQKKSVKFHNEIQPNELILASTILAESLNKNPIIEHQPITVNTLFPNRINTDKEQTVHSEKTNYFNETELISEESQDFPVFKINTIIPIYKNIEKQTLQESIKTNELIINSAKTIPCNQTKLNFKEYPNLPTFEVNEIKCKTKQNLDEKTQIFNDNKTGNNFTNSHIKVTPSMISKLKQVSKSDKKLKITSIQNFKFSKQTKNHKQKFKNDKNSKILKKFQKTKTKYATNANFDMYQSGYTYNTRERYSNKLIFKANDQNEDQCNCIFSLNRANNWKKRRKPQKAIFSFKT